ncbi:MULTISPECIES: hypothetical protein [Rahnella]
MLLALRTKAPSLLTLGATAVVVDKVYRLEQRLAARKASRD